MEKSLKDKAVNISGKSYVLVSDRIIYFNENYPNGSITTEYVEQDERVTFKATVIPDVEKPTRVFNAYSQAVWGVGMVNKTSALENAETSAIGRALGFMGIGVIESIASADEINKAKQTEKVQSGLGKCSKCGSSMKLSQKGTAYCSAKCWMTPQTKTSQQPDDRVRRISDELDNIPVIDANTGEVISN